MQIEGIRSAAELTGTGAVAGDEELRIPSTAVFRD